MNKFKIGDKVDWMGSIGVVVNPSSNFPEQYPLECEFDSGYQRFTADGRYLESHTVPSLKLLRNTKKVKINQKD